MGALESARRKGRGERASWPHWKPQNLGGLRCLAQRGLMEGGDHRKELWGGSNEAVEGAGRCWKIGLPRFECGGGDRREDDGMGERKSIDCEPLESKEARGRHDDQGESGMERLERSSQV